MRGFALIAIVSLLAACGAGTATSTPNPTDGPTPAATSTPAPTAATTSVASMDPDAAYAALLSHIPSVVAVFCEQWNFTESLPAEPGELAEADCDFPSNSAVDYATYKLFDSKASMDAWFDLMRSGHEGGGTTEGPGCGDGPGQGTWANGRKDCYLFITDDAQVDWTHEGLAIFASAFRDDGDFAQLEEWWGAAGPE